ncbi:AMP-binding protein [Chitinivorax tropicus]|nr:AMP-binding protein [Chitinivorax tropicus]
MTIRAFPTTLNELLQLRADTTPDKTAYVFLNGPADAETATPLSYAELDQAARQVAGRLIQQGIAPNDRVLLLCQPGLDYVIGFFGVLYAGAVAVPVFPPRNRQHVPRIVGILDNAGATAIICTSSDSERFAKLLQDTAAHRIPLLDVSTIDANPLPVAATVSPSQIAFLQYTSGTTGTPKGVMVTHANILHNLGLILECVGGHDHSTMVSWLPPYHDMGLIGGILTPLYRGYRSVLMAPERFIQHPYLWLRAVSQYRADLTGAPNFAYSLCCRRVSDEQLTGLDLSSLNTTYCGAESVKPSTMQQFSQRFGAVGFDPASLVPCYGLAEGTLIVTGRRRPDPLHTLHVDLAALQQQRLQINRAFDGLDQAAAAAVQADRELMSVGMPMGQQLVKVRDPQTHACCGEDVIGEICVAGPSVAPGYWEQPEQTAATFQQALVGESTQAFMRTGDLGFFHRGELYITGRLKDMIIIAGRNYYSEDIEHSVISHQSMVVPNGCAAFTLDHDDTEKLVIVAEMERTQRKGDLEQVTRGIRDAIWARHEISPSAVILVQPGGVPKTSSGKVRRSTCRAMLCESQLKVLHHWDNGTLPAAWVAPSGETTSIPAPSQTDVDAILTWLRDYARTRIDSRTIDERRTIPPHIVLDLGNRGLLGMQIGAEYGGLGLSTTDMLRVVEQLASIDLTLAFFVGLNNTLGIRPILQHAQPALRQALLPQLATGRMLAAFALTEPGAGSNPRAIQATASLNGQGEWSLFGQKSWSGSSAWAGVINVFAKQADGSGVTGFAVLQGTPGLRMGEEELTMGVRGMIQNTVYLEDACVSDTHRLGANGAGMDIAQETMNFARLGFGATGVGGMKRCIQLLHRYAERRQVSTGLLLNNVLTRQRLGEWVQRTDALSALVKRLAHDIDQGFGVPEDSLLICKVLSSELLWKTTDELMQALGGRGYIETNLVPQMLRDARLTRIFEGPTETLLMHLGSRVLNRGDTLLQYIDGKLGGHAIAADIRHMADQILHDSLRAADQLGTETDATHWAHYWLGNIAQWGLLLAVVEQAAQSKTFDDAALTWARAQYEQAIENSLRQADLRQALPTRAMLDKQVARLTESLQDIEQTLPPALQQPDAWLQDAPPAPRAAVAMPAFDRSVKMPEPTPCTEQEVAIQAWLVGWLRARIPHQSGELNGHTTFADIGLDSILAIELMMSLTDTYGVQVDSSAAWDHPTIGALAAFVASRLASHSLV